MKKNIVLSLVLMLGILFISARLVHETHITIISPKTDTAFKKGQTIPIHFKAHCGEKLKTVIYTLTDQDDKVLFSKSPDVAGKNEVEEKTTWTITQTDPSVLMLSIEAKDVDGQFNVNF